MNADGSGLTDLHVSGCDPRISPDGKQIAFEGGDASETLYVVGTPGNLPSTPTLLDPVGNDGANNGCGNYQQPQSVDCSRPDNPAWLGNGTLIWTGTLGAGLWQLSVATKQASEIPNTDRARVAASAS